MKKNPNSIIDSKSTPPAIMQVSTESLFCKSPGKTWSEYDLKKYNEEKEQKERQKNN